MAEQHSSRNDAALVKANSFDVWMSRFAGLYEAMLELSPWMGRRLRKALPYIEGPRVLEVSFGTGWLLAQYASRFETTGIDYNPRMIETTRRRLARCGVGARLLRADAHKLPFADGSFDTLVNTDAFTLYRDSNQAMAEFYRVLRPGGRLVLLEYNLPKDRNWLGMRLMILPKLLMMPYVDFDAVLQRAGFEYEDHALGLRGLLHMYVGHKPLTASETGATRA